MYLGLSVRPFVRPSVRPSVCPSICPSVRPSFRLSHPKIGGKKSTKHLLRPDWHQVVVQGSTDSRLCIYVYSIVQLGQQKEREESSGPTGAFFLIS